MPFSVHSALLATLVALSPLSTTAGQQPFFPGAEGYGGSYAGNPPSGGWLSNASVYHVTNLNDSGPGSFRAAFSQNSSNRIVVFDVAGTIQLTSGKLDIKNLSNYYIAGQTAPGPVTIYGDTTQLTHSNDKENRNVVLRYLSFRKGTGNNSDSITFSGGGLGTNLILDHVSASWSEDEILSVANNNTNVTVQYSLIHDALVSNHAYGSLIRPRISSDVTFHHNIYANNASRQARFGTYNGATLTADFRNNVVYNWRSRASYAGGSSQSEQEYSDINYVGNYLVAGPGTTSNSNTAFVIDKNVDARVFQSGNLIDPDDAPGGTPADGILNGTDTGWGMFTISSSGGDQTLEQLTSPLATPAVTTQSAPDAYSQVVGRAGNWWWDRDAIDSRVIGNVTDFTGVPIGADDPIASELNGLLTAPQLEHPESYDADVDGMADSWEALHGGDLAWNQDFDNDGYINLIEFINERGEFPAPTPIMFTGAIDNRYAHVKNWRTDDGGVTAGSNWQPSKYDLAVISNGSVVVDSVGQRAGTLLIALNPGDNATLSISSGWLDIHDIVEVGSDFGTGRLTVSPAARLLAPSVAIGQLGTLEASGDVVGDVVNSGRILVGTSAGVLGIHGSLSQHASGVLAVEIESSTSFDKLQVSGTFTAAGTLGVELMEFVPEVGDTFTILSAANVAGRFDTEWLPKLGGGLLLDVIYGTQEVKVGVAGVSGVYNLDGIVDAADYSVWRDSLGQSGVGLAADGNHDKIVNEADYLVWKGNFGMTAVVFPGDTSSTVVPEPSVAALLWLTALISYRRMVAASPPTAK